MFFTIRFFVIWTIWLLFADKKRWREILPVSIFAGMIGSSTDNLTNYFMLWDYHMINGLQPWFIKLTDDWGIYIVVPYLFIQWLPKRRTFWRLFFYWGLWTALTISIEWFHVVTNHMEHHSWWNYGWSYLSDWLLFTLFYFFHKLFKLKELSKR